MIDFADIGMRRPETWAAFKEWTISRGWFHSLQWRVMEASGHYKTVSLIELAKRFFADKGYPIEIEQKNGGYGYTVYNCWTSMFHPYDSEYEAVTAAITKAFDRVHI